MNKEIKIKKLLNCYMVILVVVLGLVVDVHNARAEACAQLGGVCYITVNGGKCPANQEKIQSCQDYVNGVLTTGECCKPKDGASSGGGALLQSSEKVKYSVNCIKDGDCTLNDFVVVIVRASEIILGITGSLALAFFIYGGIMFMVSGGNSDRVNQAKQILIGAVAGLIIVFASYMIINFIFGAMGLKWEGTSKFEDIIKK